MTYNKKERESYNIHRDNVCENLGITKNQYNWFRRKGEILHQMYEFNCNGDFTEERYDEVTKPMYEDIDRKASSLGLFIYYQTDPRGATIYADRKPIPDNAYTNACCIY